MNYQKIYDSIISKAKSENRTKLKGSVPGYVYYENHHILPKCLGGSNSKDNLVLLTAREHFICHKLLVEIYPHNSKIFYGYFSISMMKKELINKFFKISSREYDFIKKENIKNITGSNNPNFGKEGYLKGKFGKDHPNFGKYFDHSGCKNPMYGKTGEKCPNFGKKRGKEFSETIRTKNLERRLISCPFCEVASKNIGVMKMWHFDKCKNNPKRSKVSIECPYCNKSSISISNMKRFHFDNCKHKKIK